jgi:hypothetical protein
MRPDHGHIAAPEFAHLESAEDFYRTQWACSVRRLSARVWSFQQPIDADYSQRLAPDGSHVHYADDIVA